MKHMESIDSIDSCLKWNVEADTLDSKVTIIN